MKNNIEKEWKVLLKKELKFRKKHSVVKVSFLQAKLEKVVPSGLQNTLETAFVKGFELVFLKGDKIIEKTYKKKNYQAQFEINQYASKVMKNRKSLQVFHKKAKNDTSANLLISGVEGIALGALGVGIPDIPIFIGLILKSMNQIALSYGFDYDTKTEKQFMLELISISMDYGPTFLEADTRLNQRILSMSQGNIQEDKFVQRMDNASKTLSQELLYMKFLQGIPIAGMVGGLSNIICLKTISDYALLKYERRHLLRQGEQ